MLKLRTIVVSILLVMATALGAACAGRLPAAALAANPAFTSPIARESEHTRHCWAFDTWAGSVEEQIAALPAGECGHLWHWRPGYPTLPACRSAVECAALDVAALAREQPGAVVYLLNEPNNPDTAGGGWPIAPAAAAEELAPVIARLGAAGLQPACCGLYFDSKDSLNGAGWWNAFSAAGGARGLTVRHYHIFGYSAWDAMSGRRHAEAALGPGLLAISETGWCGPLQRYVHAIDSPRYTMTVALWSSRSC